MGKGIAVSETQGIIDWKQVKEHNVDYAMLCCGRGGEAVKEDERFQGNAKGCMENQIPFGVYMESRGECPEQMKRELELVLQKLNSYELQYPVMLCLGDYDAGYRLKKEDFAELAKIFCEGVQAAGYQTGICANKYWFTHLLTDACFRQWERWVVQHYKECTYGGAYQMWEYTSMGSVKGIKGYVKLLETHTAGGQKGVIPDLSGYVGSSIVGALNKAGYPSDYASRGHLALQAGLVASEPDYKGTTKQNQDFIRVLGGTVSTSKMLREGTYIKLKPGSYNINTHTEFDPVVYSNTFQVLGISGVSIIFGIEGIVVGKVARNSIVVV